MDVQPRSIARSVVLVPFLALVVPAADVPGQEPPGTRQAARAVGAAIPAPPRQDDPWRSPATRLPRFLAGASALLFQQGLADPRGCDYRSIEIGKGPLWSGPVMKTHGWVLPARPGETTRFAVAWNGVVYPIASAGEPADLDADIKGLVQSTREARARHPMALIRFDSSNAQPVEWVVSPMSLQPIKVCLLLRLGRSDLAEAVWAVATADPTGGYHPRTAANGELSSNGVSYLTLASDLAWYLFDRAACAHMRGDDVIALADARRLTVLQKAVETRAQAMGFYRPYGGSSSRPSTTPYIEFLGQLPDLLADQERRAREPRRPPMPPPGADKQARIAALIAELDQISSWRGESPIVKALVAEGEAAVGPLIEAAEHDTRLTRSISPGMRISRDHRIQRVREFESRALDDILKTSSFGPGGVRAYWEKNRGVPPAERWYRTLADDRASPREWLDAAGAIVRSEDVQVVSTSDAFRTTVTRPLPPGVRPKRDGESLRDRKNPSVAELMARRVNDIDPGGPVGGNGPAEQKVGSANQMAAMLAEWDGTAALPVLRARMERSALVGHEGREAGGKIPFRGMPDAIASLTGLRVQLGDRDALRDYAGWIRTADPGRFDHVSIAMFEPLCTHPDHADILAAAAALFEDPKSPWNPSVRPQELAADRRVLLDLLPSPLLGLASFRTLVIRALGDRTQVGTAEVDAEGRILVFHGRSGRISNGNAPRHDGPFRPGPSAMPLRVADVICERLQRLDGMPWFQSHWPLARRDQALAACVAYLKHYGDRFRESEASRAIRAKSGLLWDDGAVLAFDPLDHPATAADVAAGRAIFSLEGSGAEVRRVPMPAFPVKARWTKLEVLADDGPDARAIDAGKADRRYIEKLQTGWVWQAEEVRDGDRSRRYYGFVGRHVLTRVDGEEIELLVP